MIGTGLWSVNYAHVASHIATPNTVTQCLFHAETDRAEVQCMAHFIIECLLLSNDEGTAIVQRLKGTVDDSRHPLAA